MICEISCHEYSDRPVDSRTIGTSLVIPCLTRWTTNFLKPTMELTNVAGDSVTPSECRMQVTVSRLPTSMPMP